MAYYQIINWKRYQHYKYRSPAWIKLYGNFLTSDTWVIGDDASRALAIACMLLAARTQNKIPADHAYIKRVCYLADEPDFTHLLKTEFIELIGDASNVLAPCKQDASNMLSQSRVEKSRNTLAQKPPRASRIALDDPSFLKFWEAYPRKKSKGHAEKAWIKINPDESLTKRILEAVEIYKTSEQCQEEKYIKYPATWLNAKCWEDDVGKRRVLQKGAPGQPDYWEEVE